MNSIEVEDLDRWRREGRSFLLLDVREPHELQLAKLDGARHIPLRSLPSRVAELDKHATIAVFCHHGGRSEHAAQFLSAKGFTDVYNVEGGIDAWARRIDASVGMY